MFSCCFLIFLVFVPSIRAYNEYKDLSPNLNPSSKADYCLQQGTECSKDCTAILYCSNGGVEPLVTVNCTAVNQSCFSNGTNIAACSETESDCQSNGQQRLIVKCREAGTFPDPYSCRNSYTCASNNPEPTDQCLCPPGQVWLGSTAECSNVTEHIQSCCRDFEVDCSGTNIGGHFGGDCLLSNLGYYYICERGSDQTTISLYKCADGQFWNSDSYTCETIQDRDLLDSYNEVEMNTDEKLVKVLPVCASELTTTGIPTTHTPTTGTSATEPDTTEDTTATEPDTTEDTTATTPGWWTPAPPECTSPGQVILIPGDCQRFWRCDDNLQPSLLSCADGTHIQCIENDCYCIIGPCSPPV